MPVRGVSKPFSKKLHAANDPVSRELVKKFFAGLGIVLVDHPNKYDIDLTTEDGQVRVEVEHRFNWKDKEFPYAEVNVPERKGKFFERGTTHYVILSEDYTRLGFISALRIQKFIRPDCLKESRNRFVEESEFFYKIPRSEFEFYDI